MFTVKHIKSPTSESIYQATEVTCIEDETSRIEGEDGVYTRERIVCLDGFRNLRGGTIFVMNENGKTVSRYDLDPPPTCLPLKSANFRERIAAGL